MPRLLAIMMVLTASLAISLNVSWAQDARGSIGGRVSDSQDAVISGARVVAANEQTGVSVSGITNESGAFRLPFLLPGRYRVSVEMSGFRTYAQSGVEVRVSDSLDLPIRLEVGNVVDRVSTSWTIESGGSSFQSSASTCRPIVQ